MTCDSSGQELLTLELKRGNWRAVPESLTVYECPMDRSCRGGRDATESQQCFPKATSGPSAAPATWATTVT